MDLNGDGNIDILSGSYSRMDSDMAGLFQVLWGTEAGTFKKAKALKGTDGKPLILELTKPRRIWGFKISNDDNALLDKICTRPTAVDLNGDGKLDIVSGNFAGSFAVFAGEGKGRFAPKPTMLTANGTRIRVNGHSDPFFVDWDADGDLDLISGSGQGGVFLCTNHGSAKQPKFSQPTALVPAVGYAHGETRLGDAHLSGPQSATRVWVDDINGDGKLDFLVGDSVTLKYAAQGLDKDTVLAKLAAWVKKQTRVVQSAQPASGSTPTKAQRDKLQETYTKLRKERETFMREEMTGFVWVFYQKVDDQKSRR